MTPAGRFTVIVRTACGRLALTDHVAPQRGEAPFRAPARIIREARAAGCTMAAVIGRNGLLVSYGLEE